MKFLILDFETFGQNPTSCPVIDCSYFAFDWERFFSEREPYTFAELIESIQRLKLDVTEQNKKYGTIVEQSTLDFWLSQSKEVRQLIKPGPHDLSVLEFVELFTDYLDSVGPISKWWSRANTFDPVILERLFNYVGQRDVLQKYLKWWDVRDIRTFIDAKFDFKLKKNGFCPFDDETKWNEVFMTHNSIHDTAADILRMQKIVRIENDLKTPDE